MKNYVIISAVAAIVLDLIACIGDSNAVIYNLFMGLTLAAFCVYVYGLVRTVYAKENKEAEITNEKALRPAYVQN